MTPKELRKALEEMLQEREAAITLAMAEARKQAISDCIAVLSSPSLVVPGDTAQYAAQLLVWLTERMRRL